MNPSYVRLALPVDVAKRRLAKWLALPEVAAPRQVAAEDAVDAACDDDGWLGEALTYFEADGWTLFEDLSGVLGDRSAKDWLRLAAKDSLVFASYNDALPAGELIVIENGRLVREFRDDPAEPSWSKNVGRLATEREPYTRWTDIGAYVDADPIFGEQPDEVDLWIFEARART